MVADLAPIETPPELTDRDKFRQQVHAKALLIGIRPAARFFGIKETTACQWAKRYKWKLPDCLKEFKLKPHRKRDLSSHDVINRFASSIDEHGEHSRLYLSAATLKASHELAQAGGHTAGERVPYAGLLNVSRSGDTVHGWQAQRTAGPTVQIANVILPTPQEQAERQAMFAKLEEITRRLAAPQP